MAVAPVRDDSGLDQAVSSEDGEKCSDFSYSLKLGTINFLRLAVGYEEKRINNSTTKV